MSKKNYKKTLTNFTAKSLFGVLLILMWSPIVFAQQIAITCEDLNLSEITSGMTDDQIKQAQKLDPYIITILEETIGPGTTTVSPSESGAESLTCFRETTCTEGTNIEDRITCLSKYVSTCTPNENVFCQRVQVLISKSGIDLLMTYLGIIYRWAASVIGIISVAYLIYGGFLIGTAQDDTSKIDKAKEKIIQSIAGLVLLFLSAVILYTINPNFFTI